MPRSTTYRGNVCGKAGCTKIAKKFCNLYSFFVHFCNIIKTIIQRVKSIIAKEVFAKCPQVKKKLWGGEFWTDGYYVATVGEHGNEAVISKYVREQGQEKEYKKL